MSGKVERDILGALGVAADLFGGEGAGDALKKAANIAKKATAGIPDPPPTRREVGGNDRNSEDEEEEGGSILMTPCEACGTFYTGEACGSCGAKRGQKKEERAAKREADPKFFCVFDARGKFVEEHVSAHEACAHSEEVGGYVRVLKASQIRR